MYLLLAAIVLLLLFAASYGGRGTWVALGSSTLSALLVAGWAFIANAGSAGPYFNALAAQAPPLLSAGTQDLAFAAERISASRAEARRRMAAEALAPPADPGASDADETDWLDLSWLDASDWLWAAAAWIDPQNWFWPQADRTPATPETGPSVQQSDGTATTAAPAPAPQAPAVPEAPMPTVRALMPGQEEAAPVPVPDAPSYRIVTAPPDAAGPAAAPLPETPGVPVKWQPNAARSDGAARILLTGTNISSAPLEDIQATLKPDSGTTPLAIENVVLNLHVEGQDGDVGSGASVPAGARFHLEAADLTEDDAKQLNGAIVSFAYSQSGRRRTSIMYLKQTALTDTPAEAQ